MTAKQSREAGNPGMTGDWVPGCRANTCLTEEEDRYGYFRRVSPRQMEGGPGRGRDSGQWFPYFLLIFFLEEKKFDCDID